MDLTPFLIPSVVRSGIVLAAAWALATALTRRASASTRHYLWVCAVVLAVLLPPVAAVSPSWPLPLRLERTAANLARTGASMQPPVRQRAPEWRFTDLTSTMVPPMNRYGVVITNVWVAGSVAILVWFLLGHISVWRLRRSATPVDGAWADEAGVLAEHVGFTAIPVGESPRTAIPVVCGFLRPMVVVPPAAVRWSRDRIRVVLLHETAHVARRDPFTQAIAQFVCAVYWCDPLAWIAARHLRVERERACDDFVVRSGIRASEYADHLLDIARQARPREFFPLGAALPMASRSQLEARLMAILSPNTRRASGVGSRLGVLTTALLVAATAGTAAVRPPQNANASWTGNAWQWTTSLAPEHVFRIYGAWTSIRAAASGDGLVHVDAHRRNGADVSIAILETARGAAVCFDGCASDRVPTNRWNDLRRSVFGPKTDVDVVVRVPPGVRFAGGTVAGDITVDELQGDIGVITVGGKVTLRNTVFNARVQTVDGDVMVELPPDTNATLTADTVSGTVNSAIPINRGGRGNRAWRRGLVADPGGRGPALTVITIDGDITVRRR
jgi:beta-lactamase regulating signal transducer with metallopeptidase domain